MKAIVLLSGGLDSATTLYWALDRGYECRCLIFDYGQRHKRELVAAKRIARAVGCICKVVKFSLPWPSGALVDKKLSIPSNRSVEEISSEIPATYVPARNTIFLSFALSWAEAVEAEAILIGAHSTDYSGYPDCRPDYYEAMRKVFKEGTRTGADGKELSILTPLIDKSKREIVELGIKLGVPYELTWSCYQGDKVPCRVCDSCKLRAKGFREAGTPDPLLVELGGRL